MKAEDVLSLSIECVIVDRSTRKVFLIFVLKNVYFHGHSDCICFQLSLFYGEISKTYVIDRVSRFYLLF